VKLYPLSEHVLTLQQCAASWNWSSDSYLELYVIVLLAFIEADNNITVHRDSRYFSPDPLEFWPERWLEEGPKLAEAQGKHFQLSQGAYIPFSYGTRSIYFTPMWRTCALLNSYASGPANCVGRALALHEMRAALSTFVRRFDFQFAPGYRAEDWTEHLTDKFVLHFGKLQVVLHARA
jgi:cytochrome P450